MQRLLIAIFSIALTWSSLDAVAQAKDVILTVENEQITREDFEAIFRKNNRDSLVTKESLDEYMELFVNFKLKVRAAKDLGMDTVSAFKKELAGYRKQLARPYLIDSELLDELIAEAYERKKNEVRASHILIKTPQNPKPADTQRALNRIAEVKKRIDAGEDFNEIAKQVSEDPSAATNSGDLGWFSVFNMVYAFEEAAYSLPVGEVSEPIQTRYGYHLVKVTDKRKAQGEVLVAHIMVKSRPNSTDQADEEAKSKSEEIYQLLETGQSFDELTMKYSEDKSTSRKGGQLPWFGAGKMVEEFEEVAFSLDVGEYSKPFMTSYGWHIVKKIDEKPVPDFESIRSELKSKISRDSRSESTKQSFLNKLKKEYNYEREDKCYGMLVASADSTIRQGHLTVAKSKHLKEELITFADKKYTVQDFVDYLGTTRTKDKSTSPAMILEEKFNNYSDKVLLDYEDGQLEGKHNAFRLLMNEYRDGILLFELTDEKVWTKAVKDSAGLATFYAENKHTFMWPQRVQATIYEVNDKASADLLRKTLKQQPDISADALKAKVNKESQLNLNVRSGLFSEEEESILSKIDLKEGLSANVEMDAKIVVVNVQKVVPPQAKQLDEAKGIITAEYQNHLEKQWINELRTRYNYEVKEDVLYSILSDQ